MTWLHVKNSCANHQMARTRRCNHNQLNGHKMLTHRFYLVLHLFNTSVDTAIRFLHFEPSHIRSGGVSLTRSRLLSPITRDPQSRLKHTWSGLRRFDLAETATASHRQDPHWSFLTSQRWTNLANDAGDTRGLSNAGLISASLVRLAPLRHPKKDRGEGKKASFAGWPTEYKWLLSYLALEGCVTHVHQRYNDLLCAVESRF